MNNRDDSRNTVFVFNKDLLIEHVEHVEDVNISDIIPGSSRLNERFYVDEQFHSWIKSPDSIYRRFYCPILNAEYASLFSFDTVNNGNDTFTAIISSVEDFKSTLSALEAMNTTTLILDYDLNLVAFSEQSKEQFRELNNCQLGQPIWDIIPELENSLNNSLQLFKSAQGKGRCNLYYTPTNTWFDVKLYRNDNKIIIIFDDISELINADEKLKESQEFLTKVLNNIFDGIIVIDRQGKVILFNTAAEKITGYGAQEIIGESINKLMNMHDAKQHDGYLAKLDDNAIQRVVNMRRELDLKNKNGDKVAIDIAVTSTTFNNRPVFIGSIHDISERLSQEKRIRELARFPEENWSAVMRIEENGKISYANPVSDLILEYWETERGGFVPEIYTALIQGAIATGDPQRIDLDCGDVIYSVVFSPAQEFRSVYVYFTDITNIKYFEKELLEHRTLLEEKIKTRTQELAEAKDEALAANQAKSLFLANMSHEMRTPLTAIVGYAESLLDSDLNEQERDKAIDTIIRSSSHLKDIINDVLDISKIEAEKLDLESIKTNLQELLSDVMTVMSPMAQEKNLFLNVELDGSIPLYATTDPTRLKQILINLCSNAIKFTNLGGVTIKTFINSDQLLCFDVVDTGIGIPEESQERIFDKFSQADNTTTRRFGGTGLGLSLSKQLANKLGGNLTVQSTFGKGSCFQLCIDPGDTQGVPLLDHFEVVHKLGTRNIQEAKLHGKVLVAEDTVALQDLITFTLNKFGLQTQLAANGRQAVDHALNGDHDLILMDIQMPELDGMSATKQLRAQGYNKPIIAMTANATKEDKINCLAAGFSDFVSKPIQRPLLFQALSKYLEKVDDVSAAPIKSALIEKEPDMIELVAKFVANLPDLMNGFNQAYISRNFPALNQEIHKIKGLGGGYGYPQLTDVAMTIEDLIKGENFVQLETKMAELNSLCERVIKGIN